MRELETCVLDCFSHVMVTEQKFFVVLPHQQTIKKDNITVLPCVLDTLFKKAESQLQRQVTSKWLLVTGWSEKLSQEQNIFFRFVQTKHHTVCKHLANTCNVVKNLKKYINFINLYLILSVWPHT